MRDLVAAQSDLTLKETLHAAEQDRPDVAAARAAWREDQPRLNPHRLVYARPMADLERILQQLHDSEINAGVQTFFDAGMRVWIGDESNGIQSETTINRTGSFAAPRKWPEGVTAANWLHEPALRLYPIANTLKSTPVNGETIKGREASPCTVRRAGARDRRPAGAMADAARDRGTAGL